MKMSRAVLLLMSGLIAVLLAACQPTGAATGAALDGDTVVLTWKRDGGIAGFCDELTITAGGDVAASSCTDEGSEMERALDDAQMAQLGSWLGALRSFEYAESDGAVSDSMTVSISFDGQGGDSPTLAQQRAILGFATDLYAALTE